MTPDAIRILYGYTYWAFEQVWDCIMPLTDEQFAQDITYSRGSIRNQVVHVMSSTRRWIKQLQGVEVPAHLAFEDYSARAVAKARWDELQTEALAYVRSLNQAQLDEKIHWEIAARGIGGNHRRWELLMHVANHATDHRAQILAMLDQHFGAKTVEQDMIFYLLENQAPDHKR